MLGLEGDLPESVDTTTVDHRLEIIRDRQQINLPGQQAIKFIEKDHLLMHKRQALPFHSNGMTFSAFDQQGEEMRRATFYSVGGGFIVDETASASDRIKQDDTVLPYPFLSAVNLLIHCANNNMRISDVMMENEKVWRDEEEIRSGLLKIWRVMQTCVNNGCKNEGILPGGMKVKRRAAELYRKLSTQPNITYKDPLTSLDWVNLYALAVNEENAAGGRVVTAPTNGAAGIIPAVMHYYQYFYPNADDDGIVRFLLAAGAIGILYKENASISGAEVGCQGEVGSACSMAAGALTEVIGGTPEQVENAAEIGMEHNLGLTCDPIGGLVQVPCIERNAMASVKAINAARIAMRGDGQHYVSLDKVIKTMRETGADMKTKYKETARGGLAVNIIEC
jgi:L-serine dehydratase